MNSVKTALHTALLTLALIALPGKAFASDPLIEGAKQCTRYLPYYEQTYGIPSYLLSAIASTESGRYHDGLRIALPWPWTINADGRGYYFDTKEEALAAARRFKLQGVHNMDIGCMQVSLLHHPEAFKNLEDAFEPASNVAYAAGFLHNLFKEQGDWRSAAAAYHSKTPIHGGEYAGHVFSQWRTIIDRVRQAHGVASTTPAIPASAPVERRYAALQPATPKPVGHKHYSMKSIEVKDASASRENGVLVIRPLQQDTLPPVETSASAASPPDSGPRFIFNN